MHLKVLLFWVATSLYKSVCMADSVVKVKYRKGRSSIGTICLYVHACASKCMFENCSPAYI